MIKIKTSERNERKYIRKKIEKMSGLEFEHYLYYVFVNLGYKVKLTPYSVDYGADLIISKNNVKTVVQAKRYSSPIGVSAIQEVLGAKGYYGADNTLVVTNNHFTTNAKKLAKKNNVNLWSRGDLHQHIITENELDLLKKKYENKNKNEAIVETKIENMDKKKSRKQRRRDFNKNIDIILDAIARQ